MSKYTVFSHKGGVRILADKSAKDKPPSVVGVSRLTLLDCLTTWVYLDNTRTRMRVLFYMVICASFYLDSDSSKSAHSVRVGEKFLRSLRVINQLSTAKTFLRFSIAASAQQMHLLLPILVLCSAIFRRVFLALRSPPLTP